MAQEWVERGHRSSCRPSVRAPSALLPPGVFVSMLPSADAGCASCGSDQVTRIAMTLTDGTPVQFTSCQRCEHKTWAADGRLLDKDEVLARAQKHK